ncbi:sugar phosphate isomerase/epimerase [Nakamurella silvestris]|nr:sugar phosphate isomerase/epimerase [Nakamurella silvestris]
MALHPSDERSHLGQASSAGNRPGRRLGVSTWVWASPLSDSILTDLAPRIAAWGFDLIELPVENLGEWDPVHAAKVLADNGLGAAVALVMGDDRQLVAADSATISHTQDYLRGVIDVAATVGSPVIAGPAYASVGRTWRLAEDERSQAYRQLAESLAPVVDHAIASGVRVAVEPLNRYETSLINTVDQGLAAIADLPAQGCGLALDVYHMNIEEKDIPAAIRRAAGRIAHVQVCGNDRGAPGNDHLDWVGIVAALDDAGYDGPLCIESFTAHNATIATAASIWRPLERSQDAIATDGLTFLKAVNA